MITIQTNRFRNYIACAWGIIILFAMIGILLGYMNGMYICIFTSIMWVINRIISEAIDGFQSLTSTNNDKSTLDNNEFFTRTLN